MSRIIRQGDVVLEEIAGMPSSDWSPEFVNTSTITVEGENGHAHQFLGFFALMIYQGDNPNIVGAVHASEEGARIEHGEHPVLEIPPGTWRVTRGRELGNPKGVD